MVDVSVKEGAAWVCAGGRHLSDVLLPVDESCELQLDQDNLSSPVLLEQTEDGSPCVLTLSCSSASSHAIGRLLVVSEARTMELYDQSGEYCATVRGEREPAVQPDSEDRGPFYRKQLTLDPPSTSCEVKLLSLAGRSSVLVCRVAVSLQPLQTGPVRGPGIDMEQVQVLVEEMGTSLSPGAQNLMDMVQFQQKNQMASLGGFLPLLMGGGAFPGLPRGSVSSQPSAGSTGSTGSTPPVGFISPVDEHAAMSTASSSSSSSSSSPDSLLSDVHTDPSASAEGGGLMNHAHLTEMMSRFLKHGQTPSPGPDLLPLLQSVCGQVTQLRLDQGAAAAEREKMMRSSSWQLDAAMERRLDEMERRLKEHVDRRLDALEQKLDKVLVVALQQQEGGGGGGGGGSSSAQQEAAAADTP